MDHSSIANSSRERKKYYTPCSVEGCSRPHYAKSFCKAHYHQAHRGESVTKLVKPDGKPIMFPQSHLAALTRIARGQGTTRNILLRRIVAEYLEREADSTDL